jgi:RNA 3'-terminal phosphate cyclase (ATP)
MAMGEELVIDGVQGEGGGQILRSALALSVVTGRPFRLQRIRAGRAKPGLLPQHLTAVRAAAAVGVARVSGAELGSQELAFAPSSIRGEEYRFAIGSAGSTTLVLQAVLPPLIAAATPSRITIEGGTHNPLAPPFEFLDRTFFPVLRRMGASIEARLDAFGFYPAGGGRITITVEPCRALAPIALIERGDVVVRARVLLLQLPSDIGVRELAVIRDRLGLDHESGSVQQIRTAPGRGNAAQILLDSEPVAETVTAFGEQGVRAEVVAATACDEAATLLAAGVPVGQHLADQLLLPMALARGGAFRTVTPTAHTVTNAGIIQRFLDVAVHVHRESDRVARVDVVGR